MSFRVEIRALGEFRVLAGGTDVTCPPTHAERLLKHLVRTGGAASLPAVTGALWPGTPDRTARRRLRNVLARLRERYGTIVLRSGERLVLAPAVRVDAFRLTAAADRLAARAPVSAAELRDCAAGWRGDLLEGDDGPRLEGPRERMRQRYLTVLDRLADLAAAEGRVLDEVHWLDRAYRTAPYDESRIVRIVTRLRDTGHAGLAREAFALGCDMSTELGVRIPLALSAAARRPAALPRPFAPAAAAAA